MGRIIFAFSFIVVFILISSSCSKSVKDTETLVIWHWMTDRHDVFRQMAAKYESETGKKVYFELNAPSDLFTTKIRAAAQTNTLPDVYGILGGSQDLANFINSNLVLDLTPYLKANDNEWEKTLYSKALDTTAFKEINQWNVLPGYYGLPIDVANIQMIYNKKIFEEAGISKIPETWEEFLQAGELITSKTNKKYFVSGFGETWLINSMIRNFAFNIMGENLFIDSIKGTYSYDSEKWISVFDKFRVMSEKKLFASGIVTMINKTAERLFSTENVAVTFNGSWSVNVYKGMNPSLKFGAMFFPKVSNDYPVVIQGGAGSSLVVIKTSSKKDDAIKFLKWITSKENQIFLTRETNNLPSNINAVDEIPDILKEFSDDMDKTIHPSLLPVAEDPSIEEAIARGVQSIIIGEMTPQELGKQLADFKKKIMNE
ncbi:MAG: sugar-binding periplasmic protein [uncultured bacterium]|nr:MAG: sugar-binding periplasmic protein [uncultured bacterium]